MEEEEEEEVVVVVVVVVDNKVLKLGHLTNWPLRFRNRRDATKPS